MKKKLDYAIYRDRILGGWIGKSLGGIVGAPYECHKHFRKLDKEHLWPSQLYPNDDLDIQVVWLEALQALGVNPTSRQLARFWKEHCFYTCCEYGIFIDNYDHGIYPPLSGKWNNEFFIASEGCPIRSEIWGFIAPGNPALAMEYAGKDGCLDHGQLSIELEQFLSAAASLSFFANEPVELFELTCQNVPENNAGCQLYRGVSQLCRQYEDERELWLQIVRKYGSCDGTRALINNAFALMALFRGGNDFQEIMRICVQTGWDVDCSCATAGAIWGALHGSAAFPQDWLDKMGKTLICACDIPHKRALLTDFADETAAIGIEVSALLNPMVDLCGAPTVPIRPLSEDSLYADYSYENDKPVLYSTKPTHVTLTLHNTTAAPLSVRLTLTAPAGVQADCPSERFTIPANNTYSLPVKLTVAPGTEWLPEKILIDVKATGDDGSVLLQDQFGVHGAMQWKVYGPYWDMWDKDILAVCPYENDELTCNPGNLPEYSCDAVASHIRPHADYLDKSALLADEIPSELPFTFETARSTIDRDELFAFDGAVCCYLTRVFKSNEVIDGVLLHVSANCPYECYLDGQLLASANDYRSARYGSSPSFTLTGKPQRLVIKLASVRPDFTLSCKFSKYNMDTASAHSPIVQAIADYIH